MSLISYRPVDSLAMTVVLGLMALLVGSVVLGLCIIAYKVMQMIHLVTP